MEKCYLFPRVITTFKWDLKSDNICELYDTLLKGMWEWEDGGLGRGMFMRSNDNGYCPYECSGLGLQMAEDKKKRECMVVYSSFPFPSFLLGFVPPFPLRKFFFISLCFPDTYLHNEPKVVWVEEVLIYVLIAYRATF